MSFWKWCIPLLVWGGLALVPHPAGLTAAAWHYLALFVAVIAALILEPLPASAVGLVGLVAAIVIGDVASKSADAIKWGLSGFSDTSVWLILGALIFSTGYQKTGLGRRIALTLVKRLGRSTLGLGYAVMLADLLIAPVMPSNTGRSAGVIFPIVRCIPPLYGSAPGPTARRMGAYLMWTAFASTNVTSALYLTALGPNLLALDLIRKETAVTISWSQWFMGFFPVGLLLLAPLPWIVYRVYPPELRTSPEVPAWAGEELRLMGRISIKEAILVLLVLIAVALWIFGTAWIHATTVIWLVVAIMLLARVIDWSDVTSNAGAWDTLVYFGTLLTLADGLSRVGVVGWVSSNVSGRLAGASPLLVLVALVIFFFVVHYLFASLTAHTTAVLPALLAAGSAFPEMPLRSFVMLLAYAIGLMGVISPYATGPAPVYYGSGFITPREFWRLGFLFGMFFLTTLVVVGLPYLLWLGGPAAGNLTSAAAR